MNTTRKKKSSRTKIAKIIALLLSLAAILGLVGYNIAQGQTAGVSEQVHPNAQRPTTASKNTIVETGTYRGWTHYRNDDLEFSINVPPAVKISDYAGLSASDPDYTLFTMDLYGDTTGRTIEYLHLAVYESDLQNSIHTQDSLRSDIYTVAPTKRSTTIAGHKAMLYYYDGDIRATVYLIENGIQTIAVSGFIRTKDPQSVLNYWDGFNNTLNSLEIDGPHLPPNNMGVNSAI
jgi:hypothetical protein